jgi:hypothetical protein
VSAPVARDPFTSYECGSESYLTPRFCECRRSLQVRDRQLAIEHRPRPTPRTTIEAIMWCVRERGPAALHEPKNIERLAQCDDAAINEINQRITKMAHCYAS